MGKNDPYSPNYDPSYHGEDGRDVGSGSAFAADVGRLYTAGLEHFPVTAAAYAEAATDLFYVEGALKSLYETSGRFPIYSVGQHAERMYEVLALTSSRLYEAGDALVAMAADFVKADQAVETEMDRLVRRNQAILTDPPFRATAPGADDDWRTVLATGPSGYPSQDDIPGPDEIDELLEGLDLGDYADTDNEDDD